MGEGEKAETLDDRLHAWGQWRYHGKPYMPYNQDDAAEMAAFGASDMACALYPGEHQQAERAAFCEGAAYTVASNQRLEMVSRYALRVLKAIGDREGLAEGGEQMGNWESVVEAAYQLSKVLNPVQSSDTGGW